MDTEKDPSNLIIYDSWPCFHTAMDCIDEKEIQDCRFVRTHTPVANMYDNWHVITFAHGVHDKSIRFLDDVKFKYNKIGEIIELWENCRTMLPRFSVYSLYMDTDFEVIKEICHILISRTLFNITKLCICRLYKHPVAFLQACCGWDRKQVFLHRHVFQVLLIDINNDHDDATLKLYRQLFKQLDYMYDIIKCFLFNKTIKESAAKKRRKNNNLHNQKVTPCTNSKKCNLSDYDYRFLCNSQSEDLINRLHGFYCCSPANSTNDKELYIIEKLQKFLHVWITQIDPELLCETYDLFNIYMEMHMKKKEMKEQTKKLRST